VTLDSAVGGASPWRVEWRPRVASTQDEVRRAAAGGAADGLVVATTHQTAGRGRHGREWRTPAGAGLAASMLLRRPFAPAAQRWITVAAGLAVHDAVSGLGGMGGPGGMGGLADTVTLKWPNDVLAVGGGKLAGILAERVADAAVGADGVVVLGVGVNLRAEGLPPGAVALAELLSDRGRSAALSVPVAGGSLDPVEGPDAQVVLAAVLASLDRRLRQLTMAGPAAVARDYRARCGTVGRDVEVRLPDGAVLHGRAVAIDDDAALLVQPAGRPSAPVGVDAGDVVHTRHTHGE
jgi:BirA family biotin operon repressor/biotin-[acetyl-CoA-carboxylase] ligase